MMNDDMDLLRDYAARQSEQAFATLVARHVHLVHSAALRQVRDSHLAGEITQTVFIILARKADSLAPKTILSGWLYRTAQFVSKAALKREFRRRLREQEAHMQAITDPNQTDSTWEKLSPFLDEAMAQLRDKDRDAIVLRYFENRSLKEIGGALGVEERAAQKRVARGLEKLRKFFTKRGIVSTTTIIAGAISANSVQAAPVALAKSVTAVAIAKGAAATTSTLTLIKGALKIMAWTKAKAVIVASAVVLLAAGTTTVAVKVIRDRPMVVQGKTESEWINSIVYFGDDKQRKLWHSLGPKGIKMLVRALKPPPNGLNEEQAIASRKTRMNVASVLSQLEDYKLGNDANRAIPEIINYIKTEKDDSVLGVELGFFEMPIQSMSEKEKAALFPELLRAMENEDSSVRNNALVALQYYTNQTDIVVLLMVKSLQDPIPGVRLMAIKALNKIDPQNAASSNFVSVLVGCVTGPPGNTPGAANDAIVMLGQLHREPDLAIPILIQSLQSDDPYVRQNSAAALGKFGSQAKPSVAALTKALEDSDARVRRQAAAALKRINAEAPAK